MQVEAIPKIVLQNPYRILGVYANSPKRDIVANKGRATAFLKVNRPVEYSLDLKKILPPPTRTLELMNEAEAHLAIAKEQIKYAQFWFLKITPLDDIAFNHLIAGNVSGAMDIWSKQESLSSLQNKLVCHLIENKPWLAVKLAEKLYDNFGAIYINKVDANCTLQMTTTDLLHQFIDSLGEDIGMQKLLDYEVSTETKAYISSQTVEPLISKISLEVDKTKKVDHKDPKARIKAARALRSNTKEAFSQLKSILPASDPQFQMIADKLGLEILQCGIDYYNNSEDDDAAHTAMKIQKYALSIVVGPLAKQRIEENIRILQKIIDELPPKEVMAEDRAIKAELSKFVQLPDKITYAIALLNSTKPHLQSIKKILGYTNDYYLKISTQVVGNALHNVIEEVNEAQQPLARISEMISDMDSAVRSALLSSNSNIARDLREIELKVKSTLREAWKATVLMDGFDMDNSFRSRYNENRSTLKSLCENMGVATSVSRSSTTSRPVSSTYTTRSSSKPKTSAAYSNPRNKHAEEEMNPVVAVIIIHVIWGLFGLSDGIGGFFGAMFAGIAGWIIPINYVAYFIIEWIYKKMSE